MKSNSASIQKSLQISIRHPGSGKNLLAKTFAKYISSQSWITNDMKIEFCLRFLNSILDRSYNQHHNFLENRLRKKSIHFGIRLLKRYPHKGLEVLVNLVLDELINTQKYSQDDLFQFYNEVFLQFFPDKTASPEVHPLPIHQPV